MLKSQCKDKTVCSTLTEKTQRGKRRKPSPLHTKGSVRCQIFFKRSLACQKKKTNTTRQVVSNLKQSLLYPADTRACPAIISVTRSRCALKTFDDFPSELASHRKSLLSTQVGLRTSELLFCVTASTKRPASSLAQRSWRGVGTRRNPTEDRVSAVDPRPGRGHDAESLFPP